MMASPLFIWLGFSEAFILMFEVFFSFRRVELFPCDLLTVHVDFTDEEILAAIFFC